MDKLLYSRNEAAAMLGISVRTIERMIAAGKLRTTRIGSRIMIPRSELLRLAKPEPGKK